MSTYNQNSQRYALVGQITSLMKELQTLAPHPDRADYTGPLFINSNPHFKIANDHDGMLGTIIMENLLCSGLSEAVSETFGSWTQEVDLADALECYSAYISDIEESTKKAAAHGQGTMARMAGKSISQGFNMRSTISPELQAFYDDLPRRMKIEQALVHCAKKMQDLDNAKAQYDMPKPRFAA